MRYYACEALYNIAKVAREPFIIFFNEVFDAMFRLCADPESNVQNAVQFLDNLVKDIVAASPRFNIEQFIPKLRSYLRVTHPNKRQFLISWITVLGGLPDLDMLTYLPELLDDLMAMLSDSNREIRVAAHKAMMEFMIEIHATPTIDFVSLSNILVSKAESSDEFTRLTALKWMKEFVIMASAQLVGRYHHILSAVLPNISHSNQEIQQVAQEANNALLTQAPTDDGASQLDVLKVLEAVSKELLSDQEPTRLEALRWVHFLLQRNTAAVLDALPTLLPALLDALSAPSEGVVMQALSVLASIADHPQHFKPVLNDLLDRFRGDAGQVFLQRGGALVIRRLCAHMGAEKVFKEFACILDEQQNLAFATTMVQALNLILLTSPEVRELRQLLADASSNPQGAALFAALYPCWCHSAGALLSLCFAAHAYEHTCDLIAATAQLAIGTELLVQIDRLVQLLEAPCFTGLRLQLLQPLRYPSLLRAMYGLLMLLPQSNAFRTLHARLSSIPTLALMQLDGRSSMGGAGPVPVSAHASANETWADFPSLLKVFVERQQLHADEEERQKAMPPGGLPQPMMGLHLGENRASTGGAGVTGGVGGPIASGGSGAANDSPASTLRTSAGISVALAQTQASAGISGVPPSTHSNTSNISIVPGPLVTDIDPAGSTAINISRPRADEQQPFAVHPPSPRD